MTKNHKKISLLLIVAFLVAALGVLPAGAQMEAAEPCSGDSVSGTVVAVDETTGTATIMTGDGTSCTVTFGGSHDHPIVNLLGQYFGDIDPTSFTGDLPALNGWVVDNGDGTWSWVPEGTEGAQTVKIIKDNGDGTFTAEVYDETGALVGTIVLSLDDPAVVETLQGALANLTVTFALDGAGDVLQVSDQIAALHSQGMGFGVLVKLFALAQASDGAVTVDQLVAEFNSGTGIGQLFKTYGKPSTLGVGHVRQQLNGNQSSNNSANENSQKNKNKPAKSNNGKANGKNK